MRYVAAEKLEIIRLVERSHLPVRRTLGKLGMSDVSAYGPDLRFCVTEDSWLIVVTEGNGDETEIHEFEG